MRVGCQVINKVVKPHYVCFFVVVVVVVAVAAVQGTDPEAVRYAGNWPAVLSVLLPPSLLKEGRSQ